jgi:uncharacterized protein involved in exopolysaccharide biosynthesis
MQNRAPLSDTGEAVSAVVADQITMSMVSWRNTLDFVRRHFRTIGKSAAATVALAVLLLMFADPLFTAQTQILIDPSIQGVLRENSDNPPATMDSQQLETQIAVLRSEEVSKAVVQRLKLAEDPEFRVLQGTGRSLPWPFSRESRAASDEEHSRLVLAKFRENLIVRRIGVSYAIDIYFSSRNAEKAARVANGIAEAYIRFQLDARADAARVGSRWLEGELSELRQNMNAAARKMQEYRASQNYSIRASTAAKPVVVTSTSDPSSANSEPIRDEPLTLEDLESTASTYRRAYENVLRSLMVAVQQQSYPIANARIITRAAAPLSQSRPRALLILLAAMAGVLAGGLVGLLRDRRQAFRDKVNGMSRS